MEILAQIKGIQYTPLLCNKLEEIKLDNLEYAFDNSKSSFILNVDNINKLAISWWVSAKRTRSYPYARIYNTLGFSGKKITIIPIFKDEGKDGDRDFLQWDTVSLMSLLGIYVIIGYYHKAIKNRRYDNKITEQRFEVNYIKNKINEILSYQSDALHWNLMQIEEIGKIGKKAIEAYRNISNELNIELHSIDLAENRIKELSEGKDVFMSLSRELAQKAQLRESITEQPKEFVTGEKGILTIKNYLGGYYYFTSDEVKIEKNEVLLIEAKHSKKGNLPSVDDIKDGLIKMILFTNLSDVKINNKNYSVKPVLKLSTEKGFDKNKLTKKELQIFELLDKEKQTNNFEIEYV